MLGAFGEEKPEAEFLQLVLVEMRLEPEHGFEIVRADLDRGLAHFVRRLAHRMAHPLEHHDVEQGEALAQLNRQREAGKAAAHDHDIGCCH